MYSVGAGAFGIYAGVLNKLGDKWKSKTDVTQQAIEAVRDYMAFNFIPNYLKGKTGSGSYEWDTTDGRKVVLSIDVIQSSVNKE